MPVEETAVMPENNIVPHETIRTRVSQKSEVVTQATNNSGDSSDSIQAVVPRGTKIARLQK